VPVAADGGRSRELRIMKDSLSPAEISNDLAALANDESKFADISQYRCIDDRDLAGHTIEYRSLVAINEITGEFHVGIEELSRLLEIKGTVLPIVNESVSLYAEMTDGTIVNGESKIPLVNKKIKHVFLNEVNLKPAKHVLKAIED